jgi:hypothetical protein
MVAAVTGGGDGSVVATVDRPPSRQKIAAQDLWDGANSRSGTAFVSEAAVLDPSEAVRDSVRASYHNPKDDGFLDIEFNRNSTFKIKVMRRC